MGISQIGKKPMQYLQFFVWFVYALVCKRTVRELRKNMTSNIPQYCAWNCVQFPA